MKKFFIIAALCAASLSADGAKVIPHEDIQVYSYRVNAISGLSTQELGATQFEVWQSRMAVGSSTPRHFHETEEVFILLEGKLRVAVGDEEFLAEAPCTVILPAGIEHQLFNVGDEPSRQLAIMGIGSSIYTHEREEMRLPWRG